MLPQRRRLFRSFNLLMLLGLIYGCELASVNVPQSSTSSDNKKSPDIGTFSNFEWQAWLLLDTQTGSHSIDMDSATILRRITPKSVFVAPEHKNASKCSEGYYADQRGRCVKSVSVDEDAYRGFLLKKLNAQFGLESVGKNDQSSGPLQLNIPLTSPDVDVKSHHSTKAEKFELTENDRIVFPPRSEIRLDGERRGQTQAEMAKNDAALNEEQAALFFRPNFSNGDAGKADQKPDVIPLTLLVRESNTSSSKPEDYKVPLDMKMLNILTVKRLTESNVTEKDVPAEKQNSTQAPPTLVLLLTPTNLPNSDDPLAQNGTDNYTVTARSNFTSNTVAKETSDVSVASSSTVLSSTEPTEVASIVVDEHRDNETHSEDELETESPKLNEEIEILYDYDEDEDDYPYVTNEPDEDEPIDVEGEEILKHGEAGITIPTRNADRTQQNRTANRNETLDARDRVVIRFNDTASTDDGDDADSNVSSQVSIDGDRILETTLLDVSTERLQTTTTELPEIIQQNVKNTENDSGESTDRHLSSESGVASSQNAHAVVVSGNEERVASVEAERSEELEAAPTSSESLLYDLAERNPITSEEKSKMVQENPRNTKSDVPLVDLGRTTMTFDLAEDYVEFPARRQDGYVRFPSNEANSVHSPTYEQPYPADDRSFYGDTTTESSVPVHRKPVYYPTRSSWKPDRPQRDHVPASARRRPPLLSFWSRMPLIRDPAVYPVDQVPSDEAADAQVQHRPLRANSTSRRRGSYNTEISSENMPLVQK